MLCSLCLFLFVYPRWQNWIIRGVYTWAMIFGFAFLIYMGPVALASLVRASSSIRWCMQLIEVTKTSFHSIFSDDVT